MPAKNSLWRKTPDAHTIHRWRALHTKVSLRSLDLRRVSAGFSFVEAERTPLTTKWRWRQSGANRSPGPIPCYQGLIQGFFMGFAENAMALSVYPHQSMQFFAPSFLLGPDGTGNLISAIRESYLSIWVNCGQYQNLGIHRADGIC
jgi:hypothetical protein